MSVPSLAELVNRCPITEYLLTWSEYTSSYSDLPVDDMSGCSRIDVAVALDSSHRSDEAFSILDCCSITELEYISEREFLTDWFISRYKDGSRSIKNFWRTVEGDSDINLVMKYVREIVTPENELEIFNTINNVEIRHRILGEVGTKITFNSITPTSQMISRVLYYAFNLSEERLMAVVGLVGVGKYELYLIYIVAVHAHTSNSCEREKKTLTIMLRVLDITNNEVIEYFEKKYPGSEIKSVVDALFKDEV